MKYFIRLNHKALNPLTRKIKADRLFEVEQTVSMGGNGRMDSEPVIWHCGAVRIDDKSVYQLVPLEAYREFGQPPKAGEKPWQMEVWGVCVRGQDNALEIHTGAHDVSGH